MKVSSRQVCDFATYQPLGRKPPATSIEVTTCLRWPPETSSKLAQEQHRRCLISHAEHSLSGCATPHFGVPRPRPFRLGLRKRTRGCFHGNGVGYRSADLAVSSCAFIFVCSQHSCLRNLAAHTETTRPSHVIASICSLVFSHHGSVVVDRHLDRLRTS